MYMSLFLRFVVFSFRFSDNRIARGILKKMDINSVNNIVFSDDRYSFELDGFNIRIEGSILYVDDIRMYCSYWISSKIHSKIYSIFNNDEIEKERMVRKDALIHFVK